MQGYFQIFPHCYFVERQGSEAKNARWGYCGAGQPIINVLCIQKQN
jgi:hypothetical protein